MTNLTNKLFLPVFLLLLSISPAYAHNDTFFNSPHRLELKPASFAEPGYRLAKSYWLGGADLDLNFKGDDDDTVCQARGYTKDPCQGNKVPVKYCGSGNKYHLCGCDTSVYRYTSQNCPGISMPNNDVCDGFSSGCDCSGYGSGYIWNETECVFSCSVDSDCSGGQVCNISNGQCYECVYDRDCGTNETCNNHRCEAVDLCAWVNCTGGQSCNTDTGQCECPSGEVFYENQCQAPSCKNDAVKCSGNTPVCADNGKCVECISASDCGANEICSGNTCQTVDRCAGVNCSGGKTCNPDDGICICPSGKIDNNGTCETPNCANGGTTCKGSTPQCTTDGRCVECIKDGDCSGAGEKCLSNTCQTVDRCAGVNCSGGKTCNPDNGICICPSGKIDNNGTCEAPNCTNGGVTCSGVNSVCNTSTKQCVQCTANSHCSGGKTCQSNSCSCPSSKPYITTGKCVECLSNSDCGSGKECNANNQCIVPDACAKITCSGGKSCVNGACVCPNGQVDNNGTCETPDCYSEGCPSGEVCLNSACVADRDCRTGDIFYSDGVCTDVFDAKKTVIAIVIDPERRLLLSALRRPLQIIPSSSAYIYKDVINVANEKAGTVSERGIINSRQLASQSSPAAGFCYQIKYDSLMQPFYLPSSGEITILGHNSAKVEETIQLLSANEIFLSSIFGEEMWTSDEDIYDPTKMVTNRLENNGFGWPFFSSADKTSTKMLRCFGRYKCKSTDAEKCTIHPFQVGDPGIGKYFKGSLPSKPGCSVEAFMWNTDYKRYVVLEKNASTDQCYSTGSSSGGDTETPETPKTPCQVGDYYFAATTTSGQFCSSSPTASQTLLGRVLYTSGNDSGVILHHKMTSDKTYRNNAGSLCSTYKLGVPAPLLGEWFLADIDQLRKNNNWTSYISGSSSQYFWVRYTSLPYLFTLGGEGPLSPGSNDDYSGICTSSYSSTYRK